jgi:UDP-N-acetylglucosamine--N-acetylmuramyl-(pentapeptide) pyrophosphoryl-undecaprenol N-acetylglucosamine transferase
VPALAVADALRDRGADVAFVGGDRAERTLVPAAGYALEALALAGLDRRNPRRAARALWLAARAFVRARALLAARGVDVVLGAGGYVAGPVALAALTRRIPVVLTEADSHLGLTNRLLAPFAARVCLAFPIDGRTGRRYRVTGRPSATALAPSWASSRGGAACWCSGARSARGRSTRRRWPGSTAPPSASCT